MFVRVFVAILGLTTSGCPRLFFFNLQPTINDMKYLTLCILAFALCSCSKTQSPQNSDENYRALLVGTWMQEVGNGRFEKTLFSDGTAKARFGYYTEPTHDPSKVRWVGTQTNKWKVENGFMISSNFVTNPAGVVDPKAVFHERIVRVDKESLVTTNPLTGKDEPVVRLPDPVP